MYILLICVYSLPKLYDLTLRKSYDKNQIDSEESQQICTYHCVDHHNKRTNYFKTAEKKKMSKIL